MQTSSPAESGKTHRKLDRIERDGRLAWRLTATRRYATNLEDAWDALTNPERLPRWFLPISGQLEVGGRYQLEGNAGGVIESCEPPRALALTWEMHGDVSWVTVQLTEENGATLLTLEHVAHFPEAFFDEYGPGGVGVGWDLGLLGLERHLDEGVTLDPKAAEAWTLSPAGRAFVENCSTSWAEASIAAGTDATQATAAAARVADFYSPR